MPFLEFLFSPQAHKFRNGYYINHDTLLAVSPEVRQKLIFYFIAEQVPQKLDEQDRIIYESQRTAKIGFPRALWMMGTLFAPLTYHLAFRRSSLTSVRAYAVLLILGGIMTPLAGSVFTSLFEGRFVENNQILNLMSEKYKFGIYDFALAKKESHVLQVLHTMDAPFSQLHPKQQPLDLIDDEAK